MISFFHIILSLLAHILLLDLIPGKVASTSTSLYKYFAEQKPPDPPDVNNESNQPSSSKDIGGVGLYYRQACYGHQGNITKVCWSEQTGKLASFDQYGTVVIWKWVQGAFQQHMKSSRPQSSINHVQVSRKESSINNPIDQFSHNHVVDE